MATLGHRRLVRSCRYPRLTWRYARWRYIDNLSPLLAYRLGRRWHSNRRSHELAKLNQDGVVITSAQALLGSDSYFEELTSAVGKLERNHADAIASACAAFNALAWAGIAISKDELAHIFLDFHQGKNDQSRRPGGVGLGFTL